MDTELKAAIERVQYANGGDGGDRRLPDQDDLTTVLALAEIGRLAVEWRRTDQDYSLKVRVVQLAKQDFVSSADAFLAARKGGE